MYSKIAVFYGPRQDYNNNVQPSKNILLQHLPIVVLLHRQMFAEYIYV